jgi:hypothetical protein
MTAPRLLAGLAHPPSDGLHAIARHAQSAAVPALVGVQRTLDERSSGLAAKSLDAQYAAESLREHRDTAIPALRSVSVNLTKALEALEDAPY